MDIRTWAFSQRPRIGTLLTLDNPAVAEIAQLAGFDWLWIDAEHGQFNEISAAVTCAVVASGPPAFVRLPDQSPTAVKRYLEAGAQGIILPQVSSLSEVQQIARAALYPPRGERSVGIARAQGYGANFTSYLESKSYSILVQIESAAGVQNAREIVTHDAVDAVLIGPYDLSGSLGIPGQVDAQPVVDGIAAVQSLCRQAAKPCGIFAATAEKACAYAAAGFDMIAVGMDSTVLLSAYRTILATLK
jgi:2-dehydro-3-deoxyglucarate aldolase/4-hydroxy-2-oxoheptanedioate aldolase